MAQRAPLRPVEVVLCHAPADEVLAGKLVQHLSTLEHHGLIKVWHPGLIQGGQEGERIAREELDRARLILLLISADFCASPEHRGEIERAVARHKAGLARVLPVLLRACLFQDEPFADFEPLPRNRVPVTKWPDADDALAEITRELRLATAAMSGASGLGPAPPTEKGDALAPHPPADLIIPLGRAEQRSPARDLWAAVWALLKNLVGPYRDRYLRQVVLDHTIFNTKGLVSKSAFAVELSHVFVELRLAPSSPQDVRMNPVEMRDLEGNRPIWDFLKQVANGDDVSFALAILGPPGSGKTTLLRHVALSLANEPEGSSLPRSFVPMFFSLRDHIVEITSPSPPDLGALAQAHFEAMPGRASSPPGWFHRLLIAGEGAVLLDGLDEVADAASRGLVSSWIDAQIRAYPRSLFVVTARPMGYRDAPLERAHVLEVQPFEAAQVNRFVKSWYLAHEARKLGGPVDKEARRRAEGKAIELIARLRARPDLRGFTRNPLLLTMIAIVHSAHHALPERRVDLYAEIISVLLDSWEKAKELSRPFSIAELRSVLEPLAARMMRDRTQALAEREVVRSLREPLEALGVPEAAAPALLRRIQERSGLLLERERGLWGFAHLSLQEYLATASWIEDGPSVDWASLISDSWWREALRLYAMQVDAGPLLRLCLSQGTPATLSLALDILKESDRIDSALRAEVERALEANLESPDPGLRRSIAEAHLARRLASMLPIDGGGGDGRLEIDQGFITCAEYQIFLDDMRARGLSMQPDHWEGHMFPAGRAKDPVTGVRFADAAAFARWLTERGGGEYLYRLPQVTELSAALDGARLQEGPQAWCEEEHRALLEGTCPRDEEDLLEALSRRYGDGSSAWWRALRADGRSPEDLRAKEDNNDLARDVQLMLARGNASSSDPLSDAAASIDLAREIQLATSYVLSMTRGWSDLSCMFATALALDGACRLVRANQIEMFDEIMALKLRNELLVAATWVPISDTDRQGSLREGERALVVGGVHLITRADTKNDRILSGIAGARRYAADILRGVSPPAVEGMSSAEWARARARSISFARAAYVDMAGDAAREIGGELSRAVDQGDFADALRIMTHTEVPRRREDAQAMDRLGRAFAGLSRVSADDVLDAWINLVEVLRQELSAPERRALPSSTLLATLLKHLKVIEARRSGRLRAYEGIRIVRERARRE